MAGDLPIRPDTTLPRQATRRPVKAIMPGYQLDTSFSSLTAPDPAVYRVVPKWLRAKATGKPIYVLDGKTADANQLKNLKANAAESVTVLDGKRAAALYGSVARQGAVIITSKAALKPR